MATHTASPPACVMCFNASDPSGAGGIAGDISTIAAMGAHALPVVTSIVMRDTADTFDQHEIDPEAVAEQARTLQLPTEPPALQEVRRVVQIFRELRNGQTEDGKTVRIKSPSSTLSTAEAISVINSGMALAGHFGDGVLRAGDVASGLLGAVIKDPVQDAVVWKEYLETVVKERAEWKDLYRACREQL